MSPPLDSSRCMRLNERRQAQVRVDFAEESVAIGFGAMAFSRGVSWLCRCIAADLDTPLSDETVARIVDWYGARGVPPIVEITSNSDSKTLASLARASFSLVGVEHVLARPLTEIIASDAPGITIEPLDTGDDAAMLRHAELICGEARSDAMLDAAMRTLRHPATRGFFAVDAQGARVGACGMEIAEPEPGARVLSLWGSTVLPSHRRRGIQRAFIARRLAEGAAAGCELAVIESPPGIATERNAARAGFQLAYTRLTMRR